MKVEPVSKADPSPRRTQVQRSAETRSALLAAGRRLFGGQSFNEVGTEKIVAAAGVTRGALYHQFDSKAGLFAAVLDQAEAEISRRVASALDGRDPADTVGILLAGASAWLDASSEPDLQRIVLLDGPAVLGWQAWREICLRHTVGLVAALIQDGIDRGTIPPQPVEATTHILVGAVDEAALYVAQSTDPVTARAEADTVIRRLTLALTGSFS